MSTHSRREPSWFPHKAENLKIAGSKLFEFAATTATEKSSLRKLTASMAKAMPTNSKTPIARVGARFSAALLPRTDPHIGITASPIANTKAIIRARCPISGIMADTAQRSVAYSLRAPQQPRGAYNFHHASPVPGSQSTRLARQADPQRRCPLLPQTSLAKYRCSE